MRRCSLIPGQKRFHQLLYNVAFIYVSRTTITAATNHIFAVISTFSAITTVGIFSYLKVDIITHSMGGPLTRQVVKGGDPAGVGTCPLGDPLTNRVDAFVAIAAPNRGAHWCTTGTGSILACDRRRGHYRGLTCRLSDYLRRLERNGQREGRRVFSVISRRDEVVGNNACGTPTSAVPGEDASSTHEFNHGGVLTCTPELQADLIDDR